MEPRPLNMRSLQRIGAALVIAVLVSACAAPTLYRWDRYEDAVFDMYLNPGEVPVPDEIARLEEEIRETTSAEKFVPPGVHAHLGYLYSLEGDFAAALNHFQIEKKKFPESAHFVDGLIERIEQ